MILKMMNYQDVSVIHHMQQVCHWVFPITEIIAMRGDLNEKDGSYPIVGGQSNHGALDAKITNYKVLLFINDS